MLSSLTRHASRKGIRSHPGEVWLSGCREVSEEAANGRGGSQGDLNSADPCVGTKSNKFKNE